mgnify:CR=1 FL=1
MRILATTRQTTRHRIHTRESGLPREEEFFAKE